MVAVLNTALKGFSEMQRMLLKGEGAVVSTVANTCIPVTNEFTLQEDQHWEQFDAVDHCHSVLFKGINYSNIPPPPACEFMEFPFKVCSHY